jgi:hypothetical protein
VENKRVFQTRERGQRGRFKEPIQLMSPVGLEAPLQCGYVAAGSRSYDTD